MTSVLCINTVLIRINKESSLYSYNVMAKIQMVNTGVIFVRVKQIRKTGSTLALTLGSHCMSSVFLEISLFSCQDA